MNEGPVTFSSHLAGVSGRKNQPVDADPGVPLPGPAPQKAAVLAVAAAPDVARPPAPRKMPIQKRRRYGVVRETLTRSAFVVALVIAAGAGAAWAAKQSWWSPSVLNQLPEPARLTAWLSSPDMSALPGLPPQWNPWAPLDLDHPDTLLTRWKIWQLEVSPASCQQWLADMPDTQETPLPDYADTSTNLCGWAGANRISRLNGVAFSSPFTLSCGAAVALARWEHQVVQPAAREHLGSRVVRIDHLGSYACRGIGGGAQSKLSEHATANALDVSAFQLADGRVISVLNDWKKIAEGHLTEFQPPPPSEMAAEGDASPDEQQRAITAATPDETDARPAAVFLRAVRDGACQTFNAVLGPSYNAAHRDHFHLDRGAHRVCK